MEQFGHVGPRTSLRVGCCQCLLIGSRIHSVYAQFAGFLVPSKVNVGFVPRSTNQPTPAPELSTRTNNTRAKMAAAAAGPQRLLPGPRTPLHAPRSPQVMG